MIFCNISMIRWANYAALLALALYAVPLHAEPYIEDTTNGSINWTDGTMQAVGIGVPPERYLKYPARARAMALRAAKVDAMRNLLEQLQGVQVTSQTLVKDMAIASDLVRNKTQGMVRNASIVGKPQYMDDGSVEVTMAINHKSQIATTLVQEAMSKENTTSTQQSSTQQAKYIAITAPAVAEASITGLVIDASKLTLTTSAMTVRIFSRSGQIVYDITRVAKAKRAAMVSYDTSSYAAKQHNGMGNKVLSIKAIDKRDGVDLVISDADAQRILAIPGIRETFHDAHVVLVL